MRGGRGPTNPTGPAGPSSAFKRLGMGTSQISHTLFQAPSSAGGKLVRSEFFGYWSQLSIPENTESEQFFEEIMKHIQEKQLASGPSSMVNGIPLGSIINTAAFLTCQTGIRLDMEKMEAIYNQYNDSLSVAVNNNSSATRLPDNLPLKNLMRLVSARLKLGSRETFSDSLSSLVVAATHIVPKDLRFTDWLRYPTIDEKDVQTNELGYVYGLIIQLLQEYDRQAQVALIKAIYDKAHSLPQQARLNLPVAEQTFFALHHLFRRVLSFDAVVDAAFLERGIRILRTFCLWQQPFGTVAESLMHLLKYEVVSPGYNRRNSVFREARVVDYNIPASNQDLGYSHVKPIFYLYDTLDMGPLTLLNIIDPIALQRQNAVRPNFKEPSIPPAQVLAQSLLHALDGVPTSIFQPEEVDLLKTLQFHQLVPAINRLQRLEAEHKAAADVGTFNPAVRNADWANMKEQLLAEALQSKANHVQFTLPYNQPQFPPPIAQVEHIRVPIELKSKTSEHEGNSQPGYPAVTMFAKLQQLLNEYNSPDDDVENLREIRFVIVGNDRLLQHVVTAFYLLQSHYPASFRGLSIRFFIVPCTKNSLANYIASRDLWYCRHIYTPFRCPYPMIVPWLREDETEVRSNNEPGATSFPTRFFRETISQYTREALNTYHCVIFKLEGKLDPASNETPDIIPFLQRVEIGLVPAAEEFKAKTGILLANIKPEDLLKDKNFLYQPVELGVKYHKVDLSGHPKPEIIDDAIPYQSMLISHVPRKGDACSPPNPSSTGLEVMAQVAKNVDKVRLKKNSLYYEPRQHVAELLCTSTTPFKLLADGVLHGPYRSVRISVSTLQGSGRVATFPVQTFFPIGGTTPSL